MPSANSAPASAAPSASALALLSPWLTTPSAAGASRVVVPAVPVVRRSVGRRRGRAPAAHPGDPRRRLDQRGGGRRHLERRVEVAAVGRDRVEVVGAVGARGQGDLEIVVHVRRHLQNRSMAPASTAACAGAVVRTIRRHAASWPIPSNVGIDELVELVVVERAVHRLAGRRELGHELQRRSRPPHAARAPDAPLRPGRPTPRPARRARRPTTSSPRAAGRARPGAARRARRITIAAAHAGDGDRLDVGRPRRPRSSDGLPYAGRPPTITSRTLRSVAAQHGPPRVVGDPPANTATSASAPGSSRPTCTPHGRASVSPGLAVAISTRSASLERATERLARSTSPRPSARRARCACPTASSPSRGRRAARQRSRPSTSVVPP